MTLGVLKGLQPPPPLQGLYDHDLSEASLAAARAIADLQERREPWNGVVPHESAQSETTGWSMLRRSYVHMDMQRLIDI